MHFEMLQQKALLLTIFLEYKKPCIFCLFFPNERRKKLHWILYSKKWQIFCIFLELFTKRKSRISEDGCIVITSIVILQSFSRLRLLFREPK